MNPPQSEDGTRSIHPDDIRSRSIERRTFLGRFGVMAGLSGLLGYTAGCEHASCDSDVNDPITHDSDGTDDPHADSDYQDFCPRPKE